MNVKLLRQVKKHILKNPARLYMDEGILIGEPGDQLSDWRTSRRFAECGTAACIAGWACVLSGSDPKRLVNSPWVTISRKAKKLLGIKGDPNFLFYENQWPAKFADAFECATTAEDEAQVAAKRIDHFIRTGN